MRAQVSVPHGEFILEIKDAELWHSMKMSLIFSGVRLTERPYEGSITGLNLWDFYLLATTCPCWQHMGQMAMALNLMKPQQVAELLGP